MLIGPGNILLPPVFLNLREFRFRAVADAYHEYLVSELQGVPIVQRFLGAFQRARWAQQCGQVYSRGGCSDARRSDSKSEQQKGRASAHRESGRMGLSNLA